MTEWKLFDEEEAFVSTFEFHEHRERAPHLEQPAHMPRLKLATDFVREAVDRRAFGQLMRVIDLGCGDGGLLSAISHIPFKIAKGYDFAPANQAGWRQRNVDAAALNFVRDWDIVEDADIYIMTEVLEHLTNPHQMVRRVFERRAQLVASSPWLEHLGSHDECHAWAWDVSGYSNLLRNAGFNVIRHEIVGGFQVIHGVIK